MGAHAIAKAISMPLICVDYAEIESKYVGETSKNLSDLFRTAQEKQAVIFFDEADALLSKRVTNMTSATDVSVNQTRSVLLNLLNGYQGVILFATNFIQNFDAAFLRRIKFHIEFHLPDQALRERLWRLYIPDKMPCQADFAYLAATYDGVSGSDIANAVFSAAVAAARERETMVTQPYLEKAIQSVLRVKRVNAGGVTVSVRRISEEEAQQKMGGSKLSCFQDRRSAASDRMLCRSANLSCILRVRPLRRNFPHFVQVFPCYSQAFLSQKNGWSQPY